MFEKVRVTKRTTFEAAHNLKGYEGKCSRLHGHSYKLEVTVSGFIDTKNIHEQFVSGEDYSPYEGMVIDFSSLKKVIKEVTDKYDHSNLNDHFIIPTAEYMVVTIFRELSAKLSSSVKLESVKLWETEDSYAEYTGEVRRDS